MGNIGAGMSRNTSQASQTSQSGLSTEALEDFLENIQTSTQYDNFVSKARDLGWRNADELSAGVCCEDVDCSKTTHDDMTACQISGKEWLQLRTTFEYKGAEPLCPSRGPVDVRNEKIGSCDQDKPCAMYTLPGADHVLVDQIQKSKCSGDFSDLDLEWIEGACYAKLPIPYVLNSNEEKQTNAKSKDACSEECMADPACIAFQFDLTDKACTIVTSLNPVTKTTDKVWRSDTGDEDAPSVVGFKSCPPRADLNRLYVDTVGECPNEQDVGRFGFNAFHEGIDAAYETLRTQLNVKRGNTMAYLFQWEQLGNDLGKWHSGTAEECLSLCERSANCGEFYHDSANTRCMLFDGSCRNIDTNERKMYGMGTRISGVTGGVCFTETGDELYSKTLCERENYEWHADMYNSDLALATGVSSEVCTSTCNEKCTTGDTTGDTTGECRSIHIEDGSGTGSGSCYCDATDIVISNTDSLYDHYVAPHPPALQHVYQKTVGGGYTINDLASAEAACSNEQDVLGVPLTLCPKEAMFLQNKCTFGYVRDERMPGMMVDDLKIHRDEMRTEHEDTNATCESVVSKKTCEDTASNMANYEEHKCIWGYDDQTGDFACRPAWWNICGSEPGTWYSADKYNASAHCCTQNK